MKHLKLRVGGEEFDILYEITHYVDRLEPTFYMEHGKLKVDADTFEDCARRMREKIIKKYQL